MTEQTPQTKAGFVAIIGAPNAGKSTLLNTLLGERIAIVSPKVQTTRINMRGILTEGNTQFIFVDTPGIYKPKKRLLDRSMVQAAWDAQSDADAVLFLVDSTKGFNERVMALIENVREFAGKKPVFLALNKIDKINHKKILELMTKAGEIDLFRSIFAISALKNDGARDLLKELDKCMPESPYLYDADDITDMPMRLMAAEMTRERAFMALHEELPYAVAVETVTYEANNKGVTIHQNVLVENDNQKMIVVGKQGAVIKKIGEQARENLESLLECKVNLFLKVKVKPNWAEKGSFLNEIGLEPVRKQ